MTFDFTTPMDRAADAGKHVSRESAFPWRRFLSDSCYIMIRSSGFAVTTFLMTLGLPLFFFLLISGWNMDLLFLQLDNIANRYLGAETARQLAFSGELQTGFFAAVVLIALWRTPRFVSELMRALDEGKK
ncbi:hypothetical protein [Sphingorhabdus lacus]|uniref:Uncharacterized protein n=1 Tax=Sphingorhabdus lacus TaxID=392610 RepID=A0A6I6LE87_9SPHN|nr:hypothetical protein [Sphingorhabdus lacus]QGY80752.1 hypothetical protein EUU25_09050 [Sphingorhabdus lacus]